LENRDPKTREKVSKEIFVLRLRGQQAIRILLSDKRVGLQYERLLLKPKECMYGYTFFTCISENVILFSEIEILYLRSMK